jgi:hypothetical protein
VEERRGAQRGGQLGAGEHHRHDDDEPAEAAAQGRGSDTAGQPAAEDAAGDRGRADRRRQAEVDAHVAEVAGKTGERLHGDDQQRGADRGGHRQAAEQHQRRGHQESAAGAHHAGDGADDETVEDEARQPALASRRGGHRPGRAQHGDAGRQHHEREAGEQHRAGRKRASWPPA